jgi:dolichol kinase
VRQENSRSFWRSASNTVLSGIVLLALGDDHPAASLITAIAMIIGAIATIIEARAMADELPSMRRELVELRERVARLEGSNSP